MRRTARAAWAPMLLLAASPLGVFLTGAYADGLFIALVAWALLAARRGAWGWAALAVTLAVVTRPFGVLLVPALVVDYGSQHGWGWRLRIRMFARPARATVGHVALLVLTPASAFGAFLAMLVRQYGDPLATVHAGSRAFGHALRWPWQTLGLAWQQLVVLPHWSWQTAHLLLDLLPVMCCVAVVLITARSAPFAWTVLSSGVVLLCLVTPLVWPHFPDPLASNGRYCYAAVPVLLQMGTWAQRWPRWLMALLLSLSLVLQAALTVFVLRGGWLV